MSSEQCTNCLQIPLEGLPILVQEYDEPPEAFCSWACLAKYAREHAASQEFLARSIAQHIESEFEE